MRSCLFLLCLGACAAPVSQSTTPFQEPVTLDSVTPEEEPEPERLPEPRIGAWRKDQKGERLVFGLWDDGRVIFSENRIEGGAQYFEVQLTAEEAFGTMKSFRRLFTRVDAQNCDYAQEGVGHVSLECGLEDAERLMRSSHEAFERNPALVMTESGLEELSGRSRASRHEEGSAEYKRFRQVWDDVRMQMRGVAARKGTPIEPIDGLTR